MPPAEGRCFASWAIEDAVKSTAIMAKTTASGVMPPANAVAAPIDNAVATAGAMWVIDWNRTSGRPIALRASVGDEPSLGCGLAVTGGTSSGVPLGRGPLSPDLSGRSDPLVAA